MCNSIFALWWRRSPGLAAEPSSTASRHLPAVRCVSSCALPNLPTSHTLHDVARPALAPDGIHANPFLEDDLVSSIRHVWARQLCANSTDTEPVRDVRVAERSSVHDALTFIKDLLASGRPTTLFGAVPSCRLQRWRGQTSREDLHMMTSLSSCCCKLELFTEGNP